MKSGLISSRDPYLMDPSLMVVDPNLVLDYGSSSFKDDYFCNPVDPYLDLINCNDAQLENIIINSGLCGENINPWPENENDFDFENLLKEIKVSPVNQVEQSVSKVEIETPSVLPPTINETEIANFEEVYSSSDDFASTESEDTQENIDIFPKSPAKNVATRKRKLSDISDASTVVVATVPKRRKARKSKRVQDERVKNQNKVAALKYRQKKKDEKDTMDDLMQIEVDKNTKLKASVEELKVNIDVLKELLGKYLSPGQLKAKQKK